MNGSSPGAAVGDIESPLKCSTCNMEMREPVRLPCQHSFCKACVTDKNCTICGRTIECELVEDRVLSYLIDSSREVTEVCANCDQTSQPMFFCDTCQQPLCTPCRTSTHQAKIFLAHHIVPLDERGKMRGNVICQLHNEPYILFCLEAKKLMCIECFNTSSLERRNNFVNIDEAHKICSEKLEKATLKLRAFHSEMKEHIEVCKRLISELDENSRASAADVEDKHNRLIQQLDDIKERLLSRISEDKQERERSLKQQLDTVLHLEGPIRLSLLSASVFCSYASKIDLLHCHSDIWKGIQAILSTKVERVKCTGELSVDYREEFLSFVAKEYGWTPVLLESPAKSSSQAISSCTHEVGPAVGRHGKGVESHSGSASPMMASNANGYVQSRPGSDNNYWTIANYQLLADLHGAFAEHFQKVDGPLKHYSTEISALSKTLLNIQRDMTLRRCVVDRSGLYELVAGCESLTDKLEAHAMFVQSLQPIFREIWQEQLDRVRRQQELLKQRVEGISNLQKFANQALLTSQRLKPFVSYMTSVISAVDSRRSQFTEISPMEQICLQITTIEPDSQQRIEAIEKEEETRRLAKEKVKLESEQEAQVVMRQLKETKPPPVKPRRPSSMIVVENCRDRTEMSLTPKASRKRNKLCSTAEMKERRHDRRTNASSIKKPPYLRRERPLHLTAHRLLAQPGHLSAGHSTLAESHTASSSTTAASATTTLTLLRRMPVDVVGPRRSGRRPEPAHSRQGPLVGGGEPTTGDAEPTGG